MAKKGKVRAVSFVAKSGTGKTTLLEKLIKELCSRGYRVGALKMVSRQFEIDQPGKDSYRLTSAGAEATMVCSPGKLAFMQTHVDPPDVDELLCRYFTEVDLVLVEGNKQGLLPKIEVFRKDRGESLLCRDGRDDPTYLAVASDCPLNLDLPVLDMNNVSEIADFLVEKVLKKSVL